MSSSVSKQQAERHHRILLELLSIPGNDICADCRTRNPRWASHSLGIFLCVKCASIHRKLGTHVSKVKSVTLDAWNREQVDKMKSTGNVASNALYNPDERKHPPPTNQSEEERDSELERFIRAKYERKAFMARPSAPAAPPITSTTNSLARPPSAAAAAAPAPRSNPFQAALRDVVTDRREKELPQQPPPAPTPTPPPTQPVFGKTLRYQQASVGTRAPHLRPSSGPGGPGSRVDAGQLAFGAGAAGLPAQPQQNGLGINGMGVPNGMVQLQQPQQQQPQPTGVWQDLAGLAGPPSTSSFQQPNFTGASFVSTASSGSGSNNPYARPASARAPFAQQPQMQAQPTGFNPSNPYLSPSASTSSTNPYATSLSPCSGQPSFLPSQPTGAFSAFGGAQQQQQQPSNGLSQFSAQAQPTGLPFQSQQQPPSQFAASLSPTSPFAQQSPLSAQPTGAVRPFQPTSAFGQASFSNPSQSPSAPPSSFPNTHAPTRSFSLAVPTPTSYQQQPTGLPQRSVSAAGAFYGQGQGQAQSLSPQPMQMQGSANPYAASLGAQQQMQQGFMPLQGGAGQPVPQQEMWAAGTGQQWG